MANKSVSKLKIIAHRGGPADKLVENSMEAFEQAVASKYSFETDVWLRDDELVITHEKPRRGIKYPHLVELLELVGGRVDIYLELKDDLVGLKVLELIKRDYHEHFSSIILTSFDKTTLLAVREKDQSVRLGLLYRQIDNYFIDLAEEIGAEFVGFNWLRVLPNYFNIKQSREATELKHFAYTVNGKFLARVMKSLGIIGIFTDYPNKFSNK